MPVLKVLSKQLGGEEAAQQCSGLRAEQKPIMYLPFWDRYFSNDAAFQLFCVPGPQAPVSHPHGFTGFPSLTWDHSLSLSLLSIWNE